MEYGSTDTLATIVAYRQEQLVREMSQIRALSSLRRRRRARKVVGDQQVAKAA